jgi:hypothetical protein
MRRMMSLVTVVVVMTAMMAAGVAPAMADNLKGEPGQPIISGGTDGRGQGTEVLHWGPWEAVAGFDPPYVAGVTPSLGNDKAAEHAESPGNIVDRR